MALAYGMDGEPWQDEVAELAGGWRPFRTWAAVLLRAFLEEESHEIAGRGAFGKARNGWSSRSARCFSGGAITQRGGSVAAAAGLAEHGLERSPPKAASSPSHPHCVPASPLSPMVIETIVRES